MRYHIPLVGNPSTDVALRSKYIAAFGTACYMSEFDTFDCFYKPVLFTGYDVIDVFRATFLGKRTRFRRIARHELGEARRAG